MTGPPEAAAYYLPDGAGEGAGKGAAAGVEHGADESRDGVVEVVRSTSATAGPWTAQAQHGGPPAALLGRALEALTAPGHVVGRFAMDLLGPIPVGRLEVASRVLRPGRSVSLLEATLTDVAAGRAVARAQAWTFPLTDDGPASPDGALPHDPAAGRPEDAPPSWHRDGYLAAIEWRWIEGSISRPGPGVVWMRPRLPLLPGEEMSGLQRLLTCVDSASGVSAALDLADWTFLNTELTVHVLRPPVGEWVCLSAETTLGPGSVGLATSEVHDERGLVGRSAQALLVVPRS